MPADTLRGLSSEVLWSASSDAMVLVDHAGLVVLTNPPFDQLFGYDAGGLVGRPIEAVVPEDRASVHVGHRTGYEAAPGRRPMGAGLSSELKGRRADGSTFPVDISLSRIEVAGDSLTLAAVRDMTEQRRAAHEISEANRRRAIAEDHDRIARDLHDNVIQYLFATGLSLQSIHTRIDNEEVRHLLGRAVDDLDQVIRTIRQTIFGLGRLEQERGVRERVVAIAGAMTPILGFEPHLNFDGPLETVPEEATDHLDAVLREALSNVARHAEATSASVSLTVDDGVVTIEVTDDGKGIEGEPPRRSGLANLADRATALAGTFEFTAAVRGGTMLRWSVPVARDAAPEG